MQNDQDIPIDIHSNKLLDWLISRRHCNRDWTSNMLAVREKINNAIQDMPVHPEITKLLSGSHINYFHCLCIVELLKETESESKNIFGRYSSQRMKDWQEIVSLYQHDNIYLAEAAQMLIRNVNYEVPSLRRQVAKLQQIQQECERKASDCVKNAKELQEKYRTSCRQLGIKGENIPEELVELMKDLPGIYDKIIVKCKSLLEGKNYYSTFTEYILQKELDDTATVLPMLTYMLEKGNTTIYEWKFGKKPVSIEEPTFEISTPASAGETNDTIDFGDSGSIDFGDSPVKNFSLVAKNYDIAKKIKKKVIDFGDNTTEDAGNDGIEWGSNDDDANKINFDISLENNKAGETDEVARGNDALTILDESTTRNAFLNELYELEAFLEQRLHEMQAANDLLSMSQFQSAPTSLQLQTTESVGHMLTSVAEILSCIGDVKIQKLLIIRASPSYVNRLTATLRQNLTIAEKMLQQKEVQSQKQKEASEEERLQLPKIDLIVQKTKELQKNIENDISKRYKNRPVNLMGGVNTL